MIYSILTNPTYISIVLLLLLVFLVLFLWRKIMILEGNYFILEKRLNLMKKDVREVYMTNKSFEEANNVMNEVFKDSVKKEGSCKINNVAGCCPIVPETRPNTPVAHEEITFINNMDNEIAIIHEVVENVINDTMVSKISPPLPPKSEDDVQISFTEEKVVSDPDTVIKLMVDDVETQSTTSEIVFNADGKYNHKKLSKLGVDKLKEICASHNLNPEGTKAQLISRILENK